MDQVHPLPYPDPATDPGAEQRRDAEHARALSDLLARRADLRGVHAHADVVDELLRWSA